MVYFSRLAIAIALSIYPLGAAATTAKLSQERFESLIGQIPDDQVRTEAETLYKDGDYGSLGSTLITYLDEILDKNLDDEDEEVVSNKKNTLIDSVVDFLDEKMESEGFEDEDSEDEDEDEDSEDEGDLFNLIDTIPDETVKSEAWELLMNEKFVELDDKLMAYVDQYIETLPDDEKENMISHKATIKSKIDEAVERLAEEAFEDEDSESFEDEDSEDEDSEDEGDLFKIIDNIPDETVKAEAWELLMNENFVELDDKLMAYVDQYIDTLPDDEKENMMSHKATIKSKIDEAVERLAEEAFEDEDEDEDSEDEDEDSEDEDEDSESFEDEDSEDEDDLFNMIDTIPDETVKSEALDLFANNDFVGLENKLMDYADQFVETLSDDEKASMVDIKAEIKNKIDEAVERLAEKAFEDEDEDEDA